MSPTFLKRQIIVDLMGPNMFFRTYLKELTIYTTYSLERGLEKLENSNRIEIFLDDSRFACNTRLNSFKAKVKK